MKKGKIIKRILLTVLTIVILAGAAVIGYGYSKLNKVQKGEEVKVEDLQIEPEVIEQEQEQEVTYTNIALLGLDEASQNSDVIIIASINNSTNEIKLVSVYRDTYLNLQGDRDRYFKCNDAYPAGGIKQSLKMLDKNLDLNITKYVYFDFAAVAECVDLLGGVEVTLNAKEALYMRGYIDEIAKLTNKPVKYITEPGTYVLDGVQATAYARVRKDESDYKRTERQRLVIEKLFEKVKTSDLATLNSLVDTMLGYVKTNLSTTEILDLASRATSYQMGETIGFPFDKTTMKIEGHDCVIPCDLVSNVEQLHKFLFPDQEFETSDTVIDISKDIVYMTGKDASCKTE